MRKLSPEARASSCATADTGRRRRTKAAVRKRRFIGLQVVRKHLKVFPKEPERVDKLLEGATPTASWEDNRTQQRHCG
jgi:hypothetical protein